MWLYGNTINNSMFSNYHNDKFQIGFQTVCSIGLDFPPGLITGCLVKSDQD